MWSWVSKFAHALVNKNTPHVQPTQEDSSFKRKLSKREKKELKKQEKKEKVNHQESYIVTAEHFAFTQQSFTYELTSLKF